MVTEFRLAPIGPMLAEQTLAEFRRLLRRPEFTGFSLFFPVILYLFVGAQSGRYAGISVHRYALASLATYAVVNIALSTFGITVATERGTRIDALLRATPVRPLVPLVAKVLAALAFSLTALLLLYSSAFLLNGASLGPLELLTLTGRLLLGMVPFVCMGFAFGYLSGPAAAVAVVNLVMLPMSFASGIFIPLAQLPGVVQALAPFLPLYHLGHLAWNAVGVPFDNLAWSWAWLAGYGVIFLLLALWAVRREDDRRFS